MSAGIELAIFCSDNFRVSSLGLEVIGEPSLDQCVDFLHLLMESQEAVQWAIGDLIRYMGIMFKDEYVQLVEATGFKEQSLRNSAWVASRIPPEERRESLSFSHHREVAALPPAQREPLLEIAETNALTVSELRAHKDALVGDGRALPDEVLVLIVEIQQRIGRLLSMLEGQQVLCDKLLLAHNALEDVKDERRKRADATWQAADHGTKLGRRL